MVAPTATSRFRNRVLRNLPPEAIERLSLTAIPLPVGREIEFSGEAIGNLFFIESGIGSMTLQFDEGSEVEVCLFGSESVIGLSALMGTKRSLNRTFMQVEGHGYTCRVSKARAEFARCEEFHSLTLRYVQAQLNQLTVSAACNLKHQVLPRLARWLLLCADRTDSQVVELSQKFISMMLGTRRSSVTGALERLSGLGAIEHSRKKIRIIDRRTLEANACQCYGILSKYLNDFTEYDDGFAI